ncbi:MAG TPA: 50S ribosomal protein L10 [Acidobacteriota bacterium]|nr:50S ribosomal protein L10 [Acidobacteriota bacterium]HNT17199.1 50S ribosomal protein L10 [Acidobacteriota bacterium]HPA27230.1 50S ribosomal protein L10 [Acidobacteriota bacterium]HQO20724.1 50S ribosomal protein L10 [Acidobacteriota bacterium]HQQ47616.1 50S ribosomal protein L10 [Acidobacteriota bacterium]
MNRTEKQDVIQEMQAVIQNHKTFYFVDFKGLKVKDISQLRDKIRQSSGKMRVVKNTLLKKASTGTGLEGAEKFLEGPTAIAWAQADPIPLAKTLMSFSKDNPNLKIKGAFVEGAVLSTSDVEVLSKLPGINELRAQLIGLLQAPMVRIARVLRAPAQDVAVCISEHGKQSE